MTRIHTKDMLADELRRAGLPEMADLAAEGYYHDYLSPLDAPCLQLTMDLAAAGTTEAMALRSRAIQGDFEASDEESEAWADSRDGQDTMRLLHPKA